VVAVVAVAVAAVASGLAPEVDRAGVVWVAGQRVAHDVAAAVGAEAVAGKAALAEVVADAEPKGFEWPTLTGLCQTG
jgi:hypothetical protein